MAEKAAAGTAVYSKRVLSIYDLFVLGFSNTFAWRCSSQHILRFFNEHVSGNHLDVGVGTGYFLDRCRFPVSAPALALLDLNPNSLEVAAQRLSRYQPRTFQADVLALQSVPVPGFDSISLGYLLHCLPGDMPDKAVVFHHLKPWLNAGGVLFGTTILGQNVTHNMLGRGLMGLYNRRGIFSNWQDDAATLEQILAANFAHYQIEMIGCVALFVAQPSKGK